MVKLFAVNIVPWSFKLEDITNCTVVFTTWFCISKSQETIEWWKNCFAIDPFISWTAFSSLDTNPTTLIISNASMELVPLLSFWVVSDFYVLATNKNQRHCPKCWWLNSVTNINVTGKMEDVLSWYITIIFTTKYRFSTREDVNLTFNDCL